MQMKTPAQLWEDKQKALDEESRAAVQEWDRLMLEEKLNELSPERRRIHEEFQHDPKRCRCFALDGIN